MTKYTRLQNHLTTNQYTWLITGVAGFIGSNLLEKLIALNQKVIGFDNFATGYQHNIEQALDDAGRNLDKNFTFIKGDIRNLEECHQACKGVNYVLHQAALGSVPRSINDPINTNATNIDGFLNMLVAARDAKVSRFVYASSSSIYGDLPDLPKIESKIGKPLNPYAITKAVNELYADIFAKTYDFKTIGLRYFNIFGKRQNPDGAYAAAIPKWVKNMIAGKDVIINGDGKTSRDFCYINNAVQMNLLAAMTDNQEALDQVYNVALNERTSLNQLFKLIAERLRQRVDGLMIKEPLYADFRKGDMRHSQADITKARELLGYKPSHNITDGFDELMDWYIVFE